MSKGKRIEERNARELGIMALNYLNKACIADKEETFDLLHIITELADELKVTQEELQEYENKREKLRLRNRKA